MTGVSDGAQRPPGVQPVPPVEPPIPPREDTQPLPLPPRPPGAEAPSPGAEAPPPAGPAASGGPLGSPPAPRTVATVAAIALTAIAVLVLVAVVLNVTTANSAERRAAEEAEGALGVPVDVELVGFPVGLRLLLGAPVDARLEARDVPLEGTSAQLTRLEVQADDVIVDRGADGGITAERALFVAELDDEAVQSLIGIVGRLPLTDVELANGVARLAVAGFPLIDATAEIEGGDVVFRVTAPIANLISVRLELADLPLGFTADDVEIRRGVLRLRGSAEDLRLEAPDAS